MLNILQKITITGESVINGVSVAGFSAAIKSEDPSDVAFSFWQNNKQAYKENRVAARKDQADFEDFVYTKQDELIIAKTEEDAANENV